MAPNVVSGGLITVIPRGVDACASPLGVPGNGGELLCCRAQLLRQRPQRLSAGPPWIVRAQTSPVLGSGTAGTGGATGNDSASTFPRGGVALRSEQKVVPPLAMCAAAS